MRRYFCITLLLLLVTLTPPASCGDTLREAVMNYVTPDGLAKYNLTEVQFYDVLDHADNMLFRRPVDSVASLPCGACQATFSFISSFKYEWLISAAEFIAYEVCWITGMYSAPVCKGTLARMLPFMGHSVFKHFLDPYRVCPAIMLCEDYYKKLSLEDYINNTISDKPTKPRLTPTGRATFKIAHVTDAHVNFDYMPGSEANCGDPDCCDASNGPARSQESAAGFWGTVGYPCDTPPRTIEQAIRFVDKKLQPDFLFWTGDTVGHFIWKQDQFTNINATVWMSDVIKQNLNTTRTRVLPIDGNHECYPVNVYDFHSDRDDPLRVAFGDAWKDWIGEQAAESVKQRMYYSLYYKEFNARVIAIDTNACASKNWFLIEDPTDPAGMLKWLKAELYDAESKDQAVYIVGHIPSGADCLYEWAARYEAIVDRFSYTIRGQFFGHTHHDLFQVFYGRKNQSEPVGSQFIAPSLTSFVDDYLNQTVHPSIRVIEMDADTGIPVNIYQYRLNLAKYNSLGDVEEMDWDLAYDFRSEYNLSDASPESLHQLREMIRSNETIARKVTKHFFANENATLGNMTEFYCQSLSTDMEQDACRSGKSVKEQSRDITEWLTGSWIQPMNETDVLLVTMQRGYIVAESIKKDLLKF